MSKHVHVTQAETVHTVTLAAPSRRNALDIAMLEAITAAAESAANASVLILEGEGQTFCAGFDVERLQAGPEAVHALISALSTTCRALRRCPATVLADVQGAAVAGGCALAVTADILLAREGARLGYPVHSLGISPAVTIPILLPAAGGLARTMLMNGRLHDAAALHAAGLVHHLLPVDGDRQPLVSGLSARGLEASHATKAWLNELELADDDSRFDGPVAGSKGLQFRQPE
jgi:enoyl-CoA hydratase/carnithine racemase